MLSRLICLFGCGGDRDRTKRPKMGAVAERLADVVIVTSDNPRTEEPGAIIEEICAGFSPEVRERLQRAAGTGSDEGVGTKSAGRMPALRWCRIGGRRFSWRLGWPGGGCGVAGGEGAWELSDYWDGEASF